MKKNTTEHIAAKLNISKTTVSKAMRHCSGVDSDTRQRILEETRGMSPQTESSCAIYVILPDVPQYFWKELRNGMIAGCQHSAVPIKYNIYTKPSDEATVLEYLAEAESLNARVIILAAYITPTIYRKLEQLTDGHLIILLTEYQNIRNSFFIGADSCRDGYAMGRKYLTHYTNRKLIILTIKDNITLRKRIDGFCQALADENPELIAEAIFLPIEWELFQDSKLLPSKMASLLSRNVDRDYLWCIYSPVGMIQFPLILQKSKLNDRMICICHDCFTESQGNISKLQSGFAVTCNQDVFQQGLTAMQAAVTYIAEHTFPEKKEIYVPSHICMD